MATSDSFEVILNKTQIRLKATRSIVAKAEDVSLPVKGGRVSLPDSYGTLGGYLSELSMTQPDFNYQLLSALEHLSIFHEDISYAVDNIVQLGNTAGSFPSGVYFDDAISEDLQREMIARLKMKSKEWYSFSGGINSVINDLLAQAAITGAISAEIVPTERLDGVKKIVIVSPKNIKFKYNKDKDYYAPHQMIPQGTLSMTNDMQSVELNTTTYFYSAIRRNGEKPYAIPPFLSALDSVGLGRDIKGNFTHIIKKLGVLGFLEVLVNGPRPNQGESDDEYFRRTEKYLDQVVPEIEKGLAEGYVTGFKGMHEFKMHNTTGNVQGAKELIEINDTKLMAGLKQDPLMFGRNFSTTETLGRVILAKMTTQVGNYQHLVATFLEKLFLLDLQLAGYPVKNVEIEFEPPMVGDKQREEEARGKQIENLNSLYNQGVISQQQRAQELGYEKPDQDEPRTSALTNMLNPDNSQGGVDNKDKNKPKSDGKKTDPNEEGDPTDEKTTGSNVKLLAWQKAQLNKTDFSGSFVVADVYLQGNTRPVENVLLTQDIFVGVEFSADEVEHIEVIETMTLSDLVESERIKLGGDFPQYLYKDECSCGHDHIDFAKTSSTGLERFINKYLKSTKTTYKKAVDKMTYMIGKKLATLTDGASEQDVVDAVFYTLYKEWGTVFSKPQERVVSKMIKEAYAFFRKDQSVLKGKEAIPNGVFNMTDLRAMEYFKNSDNLYLGKFITDDDTRKQMTSYIKEKYLSRELPIGDNKQALNSFREQFGDVLQGQEWKIVRIINTTVNKMRNTAAVSYMNQAEVEKYEIVGVSDRLQCAYCKNLQGKTFEVKKAVEHIDNFTKSEAGLVGLDSPFINSVIKNPSEVIDMDGAALQQLGVHTPPFHANCRDQAVAVI